MINQLIYFVFLLGAAAAAAPAPEAVLPEGFVLNGSEGLARKMENGTWSFAADNDLIYMKTVLPAGSLLTILPSDGLQQMRIFSRENQWTRVKVWGILTLYKKQNFLFPIRVVSLSETDRKSVPPSQDRPIDPNAIDPGVSDVIPADVMKILRSQSKIDLARLSEAAEATEGDFSLIGKTGFIELDNTKRFIPDGFGRKVENNRFYLLPCLTLETTEEKLAEAFGRWRYNISGFVTVFDGRQYLLLYRAVRTYSNRNFTP